MDSADTPTVNPTKAETRYASRKWRLALLVVAVAVGMELAGKLTPALSDLLKWTLGLYCGFNVGQKGVEWLAEKVAPKATNA